MVEHIRNNLETKRYDKNRTLDPGAKHRNDDSGLRPEMQYIVLEEGIRNYNITSSPESTEGMV